MSEAFIGEVRMVGFDFAPLGWAKCDGAKMSQAQNQVLYALIGGLYRPADRTTFFLPDLRGHIPVSAGTYRSSSSPYINITYTTGESGGAESRSVENLPVHNHSISSSELEFEVTGTFNIPATTTQTNGSYTPTTGAIPGAGTESGGLDMLPYSSNAPDSTLKPTRAYGEINASVSIGNQTSSVGTELDQVKPVPIMMPYQVVNYIICLEGEYPLRP